MMICDQPSLTVAKQLCIIIYFWIVLTRDVDKTITNILEGKVQLDNDEIDVS